MPDEPYHDHEGEDEVERKGNRNEWGAEMSYREGISCDAVRSRQLVDKRDTHCFLPTLSSNTLPDHELRRRTHRGEEHQTWEDDDPAVHGINDIATI